jgi:hypothetical protein
MSRRCVAARVALGVLCAGLLLAPTAIAQPNKSAKVSMHDVLAMEIETKAFHEPAPLKDFLQHVFEYAQQKGMEVPILVDINAFKEENPDDNPYEIEVRLPVVPRRITLAQALQLVVGQIKTGNGAFLVRNGMIEITTRDHAALPVLLDQRVFARFDKTPFNEVVRQLVDKTGAPILIDPRLQEKAKAQITAELNGNVSLASLLPVLADMADLRVVRISTNPSSRSRRAEAAAAAGAELVAVAARSVRNTASQPPPPVAGMEDESLLDGCLYVTTPANADMLEQRLRADRAARAKAALGGFGPGAGFMGNPGAGFNPGGGFMGNPGAGFNPGGGLIGNPGGGLIGNPGGGFIGNPAVGGPANRSPAPAQPVSAEVARLQAEIAALRAELARLRALTIEPKKDAK